MNNMRAPASKNVLEALVFLRNVIRQGGDFLLAMRIGFFVWKLPRQLTNSNLPRLLNKLRSYPSSSVGQFSSDLEKISGIRQLWLWIPILRSHNTCYIRAMTIYRFLNCDGKPLQIHFGVERSARSERLRGHAWVTLDDKILEPPPSLLEGRVREIYVYP
jgi:hypothetical protein